jgi:hypothetical protein
LKAWSASIVQKTPSSRKTGCTTMGQTFNVNPVTEHCTFLRLFVTNSGGW